MNRVCSLAVLAMLTLSPAPGQAAAGLSDYVSTQACWIQAPFALVKCQSDRGRYPARVVLARPVTDDDAGGFWDLLPKVVDYEGIVPLNDVVTDVESLARTEAFLVVKQQSGRIVVVDLDHPESPPSEFSSLDAANLFLVTKGNSGISEQDFQSFEMMYAELKAPSSMPIVAVLGLIYFAWFCLVCSVGLVLLIRRRKRARLATRKEQR